MTQGIKRKTKTGFRTLLSRALICAATLGLYPHIASAQIYNAAATSGTIDGTISCAGTARLNIPISVPDAFTVDKVNLGFIATHSWRGDIQATLTPPDGAPTITLINSETNNTSQDNYNIELDDTAGTLINTAPHNTNDSGALLSNPPPEYENLVRPDNISGTGTGLSAFSGEAAQGNWTLSICDDFPTADNGNFVTASLFFIDNNTADLSLSLSASTLTPDFGTSADLTYTVTNAGPATATGITVNAPLPSGLAFVSASGAGSYNSASGLWTVPNLASGATAVLTLSTTVLTTGSYQANSEIASSNQSDINSTPGNNSTTEDDDDTLTLSPISSTVPTLVCPSGSPFDFTWGAPGTANGWTAGDLNNDYTVNGNVIEFTLSGATGTLIPRGGVTMPATTNEFTGGTATADYGLTIFVDFTSPTQEIVVDLDFGDTGIGLGGVQFSIFDVDLGGWTDRLVVEGFLGALSRNPILTPSTGNTIVGTAIVGTGGSTSTQANGNSTITFTESIDRISITYSNDNPAADPAAQVIGIMPFTLCEPYTTDLSAEKTVEMYDPSGTGASGLYAIPGADVLYRIAVTNSGDATAPASDINLNDVLPDNLRFISASVTGFTGGAFGAPALPAANTDCAGGACVINYTGADLAVNTTGEIQIRATVK